MILSAEQWVSLHTNTGITVYQFGPSEQQSLRWSRELRETSRCEVGLPAAQVPELYGDLVPWLHWVTVFDDHGVQLWTGPVQKRSSNRSNAVITARDPSVFASRTRIPITKRWEAVDLSVPAGALWQAMIEMHSLHTATIARSDHTTVITRPDPDGGQYDWGFQADTGMVDAAINDLTSKGLYWSVVAGRPLLGPMPAEPVATLGPDDFLGDGIEFIRDGTHTYNDVLVRGAANFARARVGYAGLNLQTIVNVDSMFGVSNVTRAANQYVRYYAAAREAIALSGSSVLHPDAPVVLDELIPSARFVIDAYGVRALMELEGIEVKVSSGEAEVAVKMESLPVVTVPELTNPPDSSQQQQGTVGR